MLLIAFDPNHRKVGRPIVSNRESMWRSLGRLMADVEGIHIDRYGSLKDWYLDALDNIFWTKCIEPLRDLESCGAPQRPNRDAKFNPRRSTCQRRNQQNHEEHQASPPRARRTHESPPPRTQRTSSNNDRDYDPNQVGVSMFDSLKNFDLGYAASYAEVKAKYSAMARIYHPDQHNPERTGLTALLVSHSGENGCNLDL
jgi:hypothetical protein